MLRPARWLVVPSLVVLAAGAVSCASRTENTTATSEQTSEPSSSPATATPVTVANVELGRGVDAEHRVTERVLVFAPGDVIHASVITNGSAPTATLKTRWTFEDGRVIEESERIITPNGNLATAFQVSKPEGLPAGKYRVEVFLDGTPVETVDFEIKS